MDRASTTARGCQSVAKPGSMAPVPGATIYDVAEGGRRGDLHGVSQLLDTEPGERANPGARPGRRRRARLPTESPRSRAALRTPPHHRDGGLGHRQPALLRAHPRSGAPGQGLGVHARPRQRGRVRAHRVRAGPTTRPVGGRLRAGGESAAGREPATDRRPAPDRAPEPPARRPTQRRSRPGDGLSPDRRTSRVLRPPRAGLSRRAAKLVDGDQPLVSAQLGRRRAGSARCSESDPSPPRSPPAAPLPTEPCTAGLPRSSRTTTCWRSESSSAWPSVRSRCRET